MKEEGLLDKLFTPFYERVKNPFLGSFLVSWLIVNWKIIYVTIFLENEDIHLLQDYNCDTKIEYIQQLVTVNNFLWLPLVGAITYISLVQLIAVGFSFVIEWFRQWQLSNKIKVIKNSPRVSGEMYVDLLNELEEERKKLPEFKNRIAEAESKKIKAEKDLSEAKKTISDNNKLIEDNKNDIRIIKEIHAIDKASILQIKSRFTLIEKAVEIGDFFHLNNFNKKTIKDLLSMTIIEYQGGLKHTITSNEDTYFLGSLEHNLQSKKSVIKKNISAWNKIKEAIDSFSHPHWICHEDKIDVEQEKNGGSYIFIKPIIISNLNELQSIRFDVYADNYLSLYVGDFHLINNEEAGFSLHNNYKRFSYSMEKIEIDNLLTPGLNIFIFKIRNESIPSVTTPDSNPYGFIYEINIYPI